MSNSISEIRVKCLGMEKESLSVCPFHSPRAPNLFQSPGMRHGQRPASLYSMDSNGIESTTKLITETHEPTQHAQLSTGHVVRASLSLARQNITLLHNCISNNVHWLYSAAWQCRILIPTKYQLLAVFVVVSEDDTWRINWRTNSKRTGRKPRD